MVIINILHYNSMMNIRLFYFSWNQKQTKSNKYYSTKWLLSEQNQRKVTLKQRQLTLKQKGFIMLEHSLVALVATFYVLIVFNCFCSIHLLFCFCVFFFFRIFWAYSFWFNFWYFIEEFSRGFLSMRVNNQLWHARIGLFKQPIKQTK